MHNPESCTVATDDAYDGFPSGSLHLQHGDLVQCIGVDPLGEYAPELVSGGQYPVQQFDDGNIVAVTSMLESSSVGGGNLCANLHLQHADTCILMQCQFFLGVPMKLAWMRTLLALRMVDMA